MEVQHGPGAARHPVGATVDQRRDDRTFLVFGELDGLGEVGLAQDVGQQLVVRRVRHRLRSSCRAGGPA